jgi:electron transfer flavoprotein beta subunit
MDDGYDVVETPLPALITVVKEINEPRVPSLRGKMKAKKLEVPSLGLADLGLEEDKVGLSGSPTQVVEVFAPQPRGNRAMLEGDPAAQVGQLLSALRQAKSWSVR